MTLAGIIAILLGWTAWLFKFCFLAGWALTKAILWVLSPAWILAAALGIISGCLATPAKASWLSSWWEPDPAIQAKVDAANHALQQAAQIATEAARTQSSQQGQLLAAIQALSAERTQLAGHLQQLSAFATRDSAWAAALETTGPVLIAVAVLALGCTAIWMVTRAGTQDAQLATVLVDEITGGGSSGLLAGNSPMSLRACSPDSSGAHPARNLIDIKPRPEDCSEPYEDQEMPF